MERELECRHKVVRECYVDPSKIKCHVLKERDLPALVAIGLLSIAGRIQLELVALDLATPVSIVGILVP